MGASRRKKRTAGRRPALELHFGHNYSRSRIPRVGAAAEYPRAVRLLGGLAVAGVLLVIALAMAGYESPIVEFLHKIVAFGRGVAFVGGGLALLATLVYYYSAGIEWPRETAWRLVAIGATIGLALTLGVLALGWWEGWPLWKSPLALLIAGGLAALAAAGFFAQRAG